ncbi:MAG TPA: ThiF family adenylyltransferase [Syntrophales bacterium]|nr:ThiF family adenylyltransferase [Syntrophales bacterium]
MSPDIQGRIRERSRKITDPAGRETDILEDNAACEIAWQLGLGLGEIYSEALRLGVYPCRYIRNVDILSAVEQLRLAGSRVAVAGAGGLGGQVIVLLARVGVGTLVVVDCDRFDETNLNRQALCIEETLGEPKARVAAEAVAAINPGVRVIPHQVKLNGDVIDQVLAGCDVVVDGLDNVPDRLLLQEAAGRLGIPMVHGALAGFEGRVMTVFPGDAGVEQLYGETSGGTDPDRPEAVLGVPAVTAALVGTFQAMEVLKILLKRGSLFRNAMAYADLESGRFELFRFGGSAEKKK